MPTRARAQLYVGQSGNGTVGEYDAQSGAAINARFITGLSGTVGLVLSGNTLFVADGNRVGTYDATTGAAIDANLITVPEPNVPILELALSGNALFTTDYGYPGYGAPHGIGGYPGKVGAYDATTGAAINANLVTGLNLPYGLAVSGNRLFVAEGSIGTVAEYDATTGAPINANFITGLSTPRGLAVLGNTLFVTEANATLGNDAIGAYDAATGAPINARFVTGLTNALGLTASGNALFVTNYGFGVDTVGKYNATTGAPINASLITGLSYPIGLAVASPVPEANAWALLGTALAGVGLYRRRAAAAQA